MSETISKTRREIALFVRVAAAYLEKHTSIKNRFNYALNKMLKRLKPVQDETNEKQEDIYNVNCVTDKNTKAILYDGNGNYQFTPESSSVVKAASKKLGEEPINVEPYFATDVPDDLSFALIDIFSGFVLPEDYIDSQMEEGKELTESQGEGKGKELND